MVWRRSETVSYSWYTSTHYKVDLSLITKSLQQIWKGNLSRTMGHSQLFSPTKGVIRPRFIIPFNSFEDPCLKRQESQSSTLLILQMWFVWWNWRVPTLHNASWLHLRLIRNRLQHPKWERMKRRSRSSVTSQSSFPTKSILHCFDWLSSSEYCNDVFFVISVIFSYFRIFICVS